MPERAPKRDNATMPKSLFKFALQEAEQHKYVESAKAGEDLGFDAIDDWQQRYWTVWLRHRWVEHLLGMECWEEFQAEKFGCLKALRNRYSEAVETITNMARKGMENLNIVVQAGDTPIDTDTVVRILDILSLNDHRCTRFCFKFADFTP
ncbi:hypothetical protein HQ560_10450 [bacterium]|nr:hypothetical protein [bacterium]